MERLPTSKLLLLTPSLFLHAFQSLFLPELGLGGLLVASALVEVFHHDANEHVEHKEGHDQQEGDEVEQHPWVVVHDRLKSAHKTREDCVGISSGNLQSNLEINVTKNIYFLQQKSMDMGLE